MRFGRHHRQGWQSRVIDSPLGPKSVLNLKEFGDQLEIKVGQDWYS